MTPNKLETAICHGIESAQRGYIKETGWFLSHAPESYLQCELRRAIQKRGWWVYTDVSPKKLANELSRARRGRPSKYEKRRFDVVVWKKASTSVRAIIEVKRAWSADFVLKDATKMQDYLRLKNASGIAYIVVYSDYEGKGKRQAPRHRRIKLHKTFGDWAKKLKQHGWSLVTCKEVSPREMNWSWGYGLYRLGKS